MEFSTQLCVDSEAGRQQVSTNMASSDWLQSLQITSLPAIQPYSHQNRLQSYHLNHWLQSLPTRYRLYNLALSKPVTERDLVPDRVAQGHFGYIKFLDQSVVLIWQFPKLLPGTLSHLLPPSVLDLTGKIGLFSSKRKGSLQSNKFSSRLTRGQPFF